MQEYSLKDLRGDTQWPQTAWKARNQNLVPTFKGVDKLGVVYFQTNSGTHGSSKKWRQKIQLLDLKRAIQLQEKDTTMTNRDVVNLAIFGDIKLNCNCHAFLYYGWQYINWELGSGLVPELRPPTKRNPNLKGTLCKHAYAVLGVLPFHISVIVRDLVRLGVLTQRNKYADYTEAPPPTPDVKLWDREE
jgi:hypothetical protein